MVEIQQTSLQDSCQARQPHIWTSTQRSSMWHECVIEALRLLLTTHLWYSISCRRLNKNILMLKLLYLLLYCEGREERKYKEQQFVSPKLWDTLKPSLATAAALLTTSSHGRLQQIYGMTCDKKQKKKKNTRHLIKMNFSIFLPSVQCVGMVQSPEHAWHSYLQTCLKINYRCKWKNADVSGFLHPSLYTTLACETLCSTSLLNALGADPRKLITLVSFLCMSWTSMIPPLQWGNQKRSGTFVCIYK